jgi:hypothetical protein
MDLPSSGLNGMLPPAIADLRCAGLLAYMYANTPSQLFDASDAALPYLVSQNVVEAHFRPVYFACLAEHGRVQGCFRQQHWRRAAGAVLGAHQPAILVRDADPIRRIF